MNVMIDLETMGTSSNAAIVAIGAVAFTDRVQRTYYRSVDLRTSMQYGGVVDGDTVMWWLKQSEEARKKLFEDPRNLWDVLMEFRGWCEQVEVDGVWGNVASFDNVILRNAYLRNGMVCPWEFHQDRCYRTVKNLRPEIELVRKGTHHNALDDALSQTHHLLEILKCIAVERQ